jgi:rhomboid protease GluP
MVRSAFVERYVRSCKLKSMANCRSCGVEVGQGATGAVPEYCASCAPPQPSKASNAMELVRRFPVTYSIMAACIAVYVAMSVSSGTFVAPTVANVLRWGGTGPGIILKGEWWRLVTAVFVHIGIIHIASNMYVFWGLGMMAERLLGRLNFLAVYLLTGIAGNVLSLLLKPNIVGAGASGAIFGLAGILISVLQFGRLSVPPERLAPLKKEVVKLALYNLVIGAVIPAINNIAHLGGLIYGLLLGVLFAWSSRLEGDGRPKVQRIGLVVATLLLAFASYGIRQLYLAS